MGRMGHSTTRAALIYQHRTDERGRLIAAAMGELVKDELGKPQKTSGTRQQGSIMIAAWATDDHAPDLVFQVGAGEGNRTPTISLGIGTICAVMPCGQGQCLAAGDRS